MQTAEFQCGIMHFCIIDCTIFEFRPNSAIQITYLNVHLSSRFHDVKLVSQFIIFSHFLSTEWLQGVQNYCFFTKVMGREDIFFNIWKAAADTGFPSFFIWHSSTYTNAPLRHLLKCGFYMHTAFEQSQMHIYSQIWCIYVYILIQNHIRYKYVQKLFFNEQYWAKCGMNYGGDKIGTCVRAIWVVNGHCENIAFLM